MRRKRHQLALFALIVVLTEIAPASTINRPPRRFTPSATRYVLPETGSVFIPPSSPDNWLGGTGNWSNGADWSAGLPGGGSDVRINTGNDTVTLDTSASINSLTLGGSRGTSQLTGDGNAHTLTIAGALTVNQSGNLYLSADSVSTGADLTNIGTLAIEYASALQVNGNVNNSGTLNEAVSDRSANNTFTASGMLTNSGTINLGYSRNFMVGVGALTVAALNNTGMMNLDGQATVQINGDGSNAGVITLGSGAVSEISVSVAGNFLNSGTFLMNNSDEGGPSIVSIGATLTNTSGGSMAISGMVTVGGNLVNQGGLSLSSAFDEGNGILQVNGDATNSGTITLGGDGQGNTLAVGGRLDVPPNAHPFITRDSRF